MSNPNSGTVPGPFKFTPPKFDSSPTLPASSSDKPQLPVSEGQEASIAPTPSTQISSQQRESLKARRRVPDSQRKRTKLSCDACKVRRCKCLRLEGSPKSDDGDDGLPPCKLCVDAGISCVTTMPRKHRIYGSVENLDRRYRAMDALISGLYPQLGTDATAEELITFAKEMGVYMPELSSESPALQKSQNSKSPPAAPAHVSRSPPDTTPPIGGGKSAASSTTFIKDTGGRSHFVGSFGTLATFGRIRDLTARRLMASSDPSAPERMEHIESQSVTNAIASSFDGPEFVGPGDRPHEGDTQQFTAHPRSERSVLIQAHSKQSTTDRPVHLRHFVPASQVKLPNKGVADACVGAFFDHVHPDFMLIHRPTFQRDYEDLWKSASKHRNNQSGIGQGQTHVSMGWLCCMYMMFILGSRSLPQGPDSLDFQRTYSATVKELPSMLNSSSLPNVSALMLLSLNSHNTNDRTGSWAYLGAACRLAISLGMHREDVGYTFSPVEREIRKRVWWTMYDYEQYLCCSLGRPSAIEDAEVDVGVADEDILQCATSQPRHYVDFSARLVRLLGSIRRDVHESSSSPVSKLPRVVELLRSLLVWKTSLPSELRPTLSAENVRDPGRWRRIMVLHVQYQSVLNFLTQRFLLEEVQAFDEGRDLGDDVFIITNLSRICVTSAMRSVELLVELWRAKCFNGTSSLDTYYAYLASMEISLRLLAPDLLTLRHDKHSQETTERKLEPCVDRSEVQTTKPKSELELDLDAFVAQYHLVENHGIAELTNAVRQINDMLKTVNMCGFSAQCYKIASEFAKAVGAVDGHPSSTLFGGRLGQEIDTVKGNMTIGRSQTGTPKPMPSIAPSFPNDVKAPAPGASQQQQVLEQAGQGAMPPNGFQSGEMDFDYSGVFNAGNWVDIPYTQPSDVQWDMVLRPDQWEQPDDMLADMGSWSWSWSTQSGFPCNDMGQNQ
ncbi:fungal-specific transcription factor domain-containing protein [Xylariales sp. AK1849]|nr:fungal-specific transcription factor domain-containing protein [Xylariales sp. AK1849]